MPASTRDRIVDTTAGLFRKQGYNSTGVKQIVTEAKAPFGSLYHFFPGGKEQLAAEVIRTSGRAYGQLGPAVFGPAPDLLTGVHDFFHLAGVHLQESGWEDACPIATVALEVASTSEPLREATAEVFTEWIEGFTLLLAAHGITQERARALAFAMISALEGAFVLARALRTVEPLEAAGSAMVVAVRDELQQSG